MALIVQKFGGTSVADADRIREVAKHVAWTRQNGDEVVVVVSAMGKTTDELIRMADDVSSVTPARELDMLLTAGERITMSLLCMALAELGVEAASFTGSQAGIITDTTHTKAKIVEVRADRLTEALARGVVPVVAGFQGVSTTRDITTLGRGGSDTTAVALAAALSADRCEIYTDVSGVFTADPRVVPSARRLRQVSFDEMLEIAATGGRVLALRSVEFARNHHVPVHVRSSFTWEPGTWVTEEDPSMEQPIVSAVTSDASEVKVTITGVPDRPGIAAVVFRALADSAVNVDMIVQNTSHRGDDRHLLHRRTRRPRRGKRRSPSRSRRRSARRAVLVDEGIAQVSIVGAGMKTHPGVTATMFEALARESINIEMISTSPIRISCVVACRSASTTRCAPCTTPSASKAESDVTARHVLASLARVRVGIFGATGQVGGVMRRSSTSGAFPSTEMRFFASHRSAGTTARLGDGRRSSSRTPTTADSAGLDIALFSCGKAAFARARPAWSPPPARSSSTTPRRGGWIPRCRSSSPR